MSFVSKIVLATIIIFGAIGTWQLARAMRHDSEKTDAPTKIPVDKAVRLQRNIARVQRFANFAYGLQLQYNKAESEIAAERDELRLAAAELKVGYDDLIAGSAVINDDGTLTRPKAPVVAAAASPPPPSPATAATNQPSRAPAKP